MSLVLKWLIKEGGLEGRLPIVKGKMHCTG